MKRRQSIAIGTSALLAGVSLSTSGASAVGQDKVADKAEGPQQLDPKQVKQFVGSSHGNFEVVKKLTKSTPMLVNAAWDWVDGDWETGLGAASHVGQRDIAKFLLEHGARVDLFALTMLGETDAVKAILKVYPQVHEVPGPHGIPLVSHAIVGGQHATEVLQLVLDAGANVDQASNQGQTPLMVAARGGKLDVVEQLVSLGANTALTDKKGQTALDHAKSRDQTKVAQWLESNS